MKALFIDEPGKVCVRDVATPDIQPDEVLLRIKTVGFCGTDLATFRGRNPLVEYPRIPGHEVGATIEEVGANVPDHLHVGMNVTLSPYSNCGSCAACRRGRPNCCRNNQTLGVQRDGLLAPLARVPWQKLIASPVLPVRELALVEPLTVGFHAAARGAVADGDTVAVFGAGAIGLGAIAGAAARGARVISVDIDDAKTGLAREAGASEAINSRTEDLHEGLQALTDGEGPDVIVEAVGTPATYRAAVDEVAYAGRVVCIGYAKEPVEYETKYFVMKELDIRGSRNATAEDFRAVVTMLETGEFPVDEVITRTVDLVGAGNALREWSEAPDRVIKIQVAV